MYNEVFEQWMKSNKNMALPFNGWNKAATEMYQRILQQNIEIMGETFSRTSDQLTRMSHIKKPEDFLNLQKECLSENTAATVENIQTLLRATSENIERITNLWTTTQEQPAPRSPEKSTR
jgi:lipopolysaccharide biosynthesis regulator YciM